MITRQHSAILFWAMTKKYPIAEATQRFNEEVPWALLPDGIRAYIGQRQAGHFERATNGEVAWMKYPAADVLKGLNKESAKEHIKFYVPDAFPKCVIGEDTLIWEFHQKNKTHDHYKALRIHLEQDVILDNALRERLIDHSQRFKDKFTVRHSKQEIDGAELRKQVALFEELGFVHLLGMVYAETGVVLDSDWFDKNVFCSLKRTYPADLAENTYKYMRFSPELQKRISEKDFYLTKEEKKSVYMAKDLIDTLNAMYYRALLVTEGVLNYQVE